LLTYVCAVSVPNEIVCIFADHLKCVPCLLYDLWTVRIVRIVLCTDLTSSLYCMLLGILVIFIIVIILNHGGNNGASKLEKK